MSELDKPVGGFRRAFQSVFHMAWVHSDGTNDALEMMRHASQFAKNEAGSDATFSVYRPVLSPDHMQSLLWVEQFPDLMSWAQVETAAQTSPEFFSMIGPIVAKGGLTMGNSEIMVDDTLGSHATQQSDAPFVQWTRIRGPLSNMVTHMPRLADELQATLHEEGFIDVRVRFLGMPTSAGPNRNTGHVWIEYKDDATAMAAISFQECASGLNAWRSSLRNLVDTFEHRQLLVHEASL